MPDDPIEPAHPSAEDRSLRRSSPSEEDPTVAGPAGKDVETVSMGGPLADGVSAEKPARVIGRYKLVKELGRGGFGMVWQAEQTEPIRREVAVKIIKPGMDSQEISARFEAERQALALMDHPNIASVLDAGTTEGGRPYFVMELVKGVPITEFCDERKLGVRERIELFIPVCQAVQHAHQKSILHRDLKPSNILVTEVDGKPVPKVIDFGIAKALGASHNQMLEASLALTQAGMVVGTPQYMSPEQAGSVPDVDTRSDVYTLGVILHELLTGQTPLSREQLRRVAFDEVLRLIREGDIKRPSSRLIPVTEAVQQHAAERNSNPKRLSLALRGDLDWILLKALEKERNRRYDAANAFAQDLRRCLDDEPVSASPPSAAYLLRKLVRRHRAGFAATAGVIFALALGLGVAAWQYREEAKARRKADRSEAMAQAERQRSESLLKKTQLQRAEELLDADDSSSGIAFLAHVLRRDPQDLITASRLLSALRDRSHARLSAGPWRESGAKIIGWGPDGNSLLIVTPEKILRWRLQEKEPDAIPLLSSKKLTYYSLPMLNGDATKLVCFQDWGKGQVFDALGGTAQTTPLVEPGASLGLNTSESAGMIAAFSPDGRWVFMITSAGGASAWDVQKSERVGAFGGAPTAATFNPDGRTLAVGLRDGTVQLREADGKDWKILRQWHAGDGFIRSIRFSGDQLFVHCKNSELLRYHLQEGPGDPEVLSLGEAISYDVSTASGLVAIGRVDHKVELLSIATGKPRMTPLDAHEYVNEVAISRDGCRLLAATERGVQVWSCLGAESITATRKFPGSLTKDLFGYRRNALFSEDGKRIAVAQTDGTLSVWDIDVTRSLPISFPMRGQNSQMELHPQGDRIATGNVEEGQAAVWDLSTGRLESPIISVAKPGRKLLCLAFEPGSPRLWTGIDGQSLPEVIKVQPWDWRSGRKDGKGLATVGYAFRLNFDASGHRLLMRDNRNHVFELPGMVEKPGDWTKTIFPGGQFTLDGRSMLQYENGQGVRRWNVDTGQPDSPVFAAGLKLTGLSSTKDGNVCVTVHPGGSVRAWETHTGKPLGPEIRQKAEVYDASVDLPSDLLVTTSADHTARLWRISTGEAVGHPMFHREVIYGAAFSPDARRLATCSYDRTVRLWDVPSCRPLTEAMPVAISDVHECQWLPDGQRLIACGRSPTQCWEMPVVKSAAPAWLADWAEAVGGFQLDAEDEVVALPLGADRRFQEMAMSIKSDDLYSQTLRWFYQPVDSRPISPQAHVVRRDLVASLCGVDDAVKSALALDLAPDAPLPWVSLLWAGFEKEEKPDVATQLTLAKVMERGRTSKGDAAAVSILEAMLKVHNRDQAIASCRQALELGLDAHWAEKVKVQLARLLVGASQPQAASRLLKEVLGTIIPEDHANATRSEIVALRRKLLLAENQVEEAGRDNSALLGLPARADNTPANLLDLSCFFNARLDESFEPSTGNFGEVPGGLSEFGGVKFDVRGNIQLRARARDADTHGYFRRADTEHPVSVPGIPVDAACQKLHFLHCAVTQFNPPDKAQGAYAIHYVDGQNITIPLFKYKEVRDCHRTDQAALADAPASAGDGLTLSTVWRGHDSWTRKQAFARLCLYVLTWENPRPEVPVKSIDLISNAEDAGLCVFAITRE